MCDLTTVLLIDRICYFGMVQIGSTRSPRCVRLGPKIAGVFSPENLTLLYDDCTIARKNSCLIMTKRRYCGREQT
jgi:hypothetical protein